MSSPFLPVNVTCLILGEPRKLFCLVNFMFSLLFLYILAKLHIFGCLNLPHNICDCKATFAARVICQISSDSVDIGEKFSEQRAKGKFLI